LGVLNLTNRQKIVESKAIELAKPPPTTATLVTQALPHTTPTHRQLENSCH